MPLVVKIVSLTTCLSNDKLNQSEQLTQSPLYLTSQIFEQPFAKLVFSLIFSPHIKVSSNSISHVLLTSQLSYLARFYL